MLYIIRTIILENNKNATDPYTLYPSEIGQLDNVKVLNIINKNSATEISNQFAFSDKLEHLNLVNFTFKMPLDLPNTLNKLSLSDVTFEKPLDFPNTLEDLSLNNVTFTMPLILPTSIKTLYISNFNYDYSYIASLTNLESISFNFKSDIPSNDKLSPLKNLTNVKKISFYKSENKITEIPEFIYSLKNLEELDCSYQAIKKIPENLCALTNLKKLNFYNNELEGTLPKCLNNISSLSYVDFSSNIKLKGDALYDTGEWCDYDYTDVKFDPDMQCIKNVRNNSSLEYSNEIRGFDFTGAILSAVIIFLLTAIFFILKYYHKLKIKERNNPNEKHTRTKILLILLIVILVFIILFLMKMLFLFIIAKSIELGNND